MSRLKRLIVEIHRRSLWQVLGIYIVGGWIAFQVAQTLTEGLGLPDWFPGLALGLLIVLLPVVLATAFVQEGVRGPRRPETLPPFVAGPSAGETPTETTEPEAAEPAVGEARGAHHRVFTWRNAGLGVVIALGVWGIVATGWLVLHEPGVAQPPTGKSVAVLPFVNLSADPESEYFSDGMTDAIITHLTKIADLKVTSRTSSMQYKGADKSLLDIAAELGVTTIVEGSVQQTGDRVRVNAQLIDAQTDEHLWAEIYDRDLTDIFAIQSDIAQQIVAALQATLTPAEKGRVESKPTESIAAYDDYLRGRYFWNKRTDEDLLRAIEYFEEALTKDSVYALAYAGLADCYALLGRYSALRPQEAILTARLAALKALEIDSTLAEAHTSLGFIKTWYDRDWPSAEAHFRLAIQVKPSYATAHQWYGIYLRTVGRLDEALAEYRRALELDPLSLIINSGFGTTLYLAGRYDEAIEQHQRTLEIDADFWRPHQDLWRIYARQGMYEKAVAELEKAMLLPRTGYSGASPEEVEAFRLAYASSGWTGALERRLQQLQDRAKQEYVSPADIAYLYTLLGRKDEAFEYLERAYEERVGVGLLAFKVSPSWDSLRSDSRFTDLLKRMDLE
ncbi:MAG: tetratricopeptide repeat protein [Gemmatimonadetes bacterium]|nr:tetratricopeptide repeat protein [Gemmatimonadota bacterium]NIO30856.1 tetratricopeptide repeat protein [Gemmatimonadota bacterium]